MKVIFKLDTNTEVSTTPDQLLLVNNGDGQIALGYRIHGDQMVPLFNFKGQFFTEETLAARDAAVAKAAVEATTQKQEAPGAVAAPQAAH